MFPAARDADLADQMIRFVVANPHVDVCICGVHTVDQVRQNFAAAAEKLSAAPTGVGRRLACAPVDHNDWLERDWLGSHA